MTVPPALRLFSAAGAAALATFLPVLAATAQSVQAPVSDPSPDAQLDSFIVHEDFEISLWADESLGIANPVAIHWDAAGRLWVLTTLAYAQRGPGESADDKLLVLEDRDGDGRAEVSTVFADGLDMPMGFAPGHGGVYLGEGEHLLFLQDRDGDGKADSREILLSGFGTGDTHQNISNFTWDEQGRLYFSQGLHCWSHVETPWGIARGDTAGFWRLDPLALRLEPFCFPSLASQNPCGIVFDTRGSLFIKSNNRELIYATPGLVPTTHPLDLQRVGNLGSTPGKSMGGELASSPHLPDWIQDHILIAGYYDHRVSALPLVEEGAGYARTEPVDLLVSGHESFRPVDIRVGPDGAIYIADWFNPIIGHYQASLRHPDRDKSHGRIWRLSAKGREPAAGWTPLPVRWIPPGGRDAASPAPAPEPPPSDFAPLSPRQRLHAVLAWANRPEADSLGMALRALDHGPDQFLLYSLTQSVHALAPHWLPAWQAGEMEFEKPEHLAFALEAWGGPESPAIARDTLARDDLDPATRQRFALVLARTGDSQDLRGLLHGPDPAPALLGALAEAWTSRQAKPAAPYAPRLEELTGAEQPAATRAAALRLAGLWEARELAALVSRLAGDGTLPLGVRVPALHAHARIAGQAALPLLAGLASSGDADLNLRRGAVEAVATLDIGRAAAITAAILAAEPPSDLTTGFLLPLLNRSGGGDALAREMENTAISPDRAQHLLFALAEMGRAEARLSAALNAALGVQSGAPPYSPDFVSALAAEVRESGNPGRGREIYHRAELSCVACHQIGGIGGTLGPALDSVGAGLPLDLVIESILWPERQLKEGYFAVTAVTTGGQVFTGYEERERDGILFLRDTATRQTHPVPLDQIAERRNIGTLMPAGLTNSLERDELRDLAAFLASLRGNP